VVPDREDRIAEALDMKVGEGDNEKEDRPKELRNSDDNWKKTEVPEHVDVHDAAGVHVCGPESIEGGAWTADNLAEEGREDRCRMMAEYGADNAEVDSHSEAEERDAPDVHCCSFLLDLDRGRLLDCFVVGYSWFQMPPEAVAAAVRIRIPT
jgi:hypothetical protein